LESKSVFKATEKKSKDK